MKRQTTFCGSVKDNTRNHIFLRCTPGRRKERGTGGGCLRVSGRQAVVAAAARPGASSSHASVHSRSAHTHLHRVGGRRVGGWVSRASVCLNGTCIACVRVYVRFMWWRCGRRRRARFRGSAGSCMPSFGLLPPSRQRSPQCSHAHLASKGAPRLPVPATADPLPPGCTARAVCA